MALMLRFLAAALSLPHSALGGSVAELSWTAFDDSRFWIEKNLNETLEGYHVLTGTTKRWRDSSLEVHAVATANRGAVRATAGLIRGLTSMRITYGWSDTWPHSVGLYGVSVTERSDSPRKCLESRFCGPPVSLKVEFEIPKALLLLNMEIYPKRYGKAQQDFSVKGTLGVEAVLYDDCLRMKTSDVTVAQSGIQWGRDFRMLLDSKDQSRLFPRDFREKLFSDLKLEVTLSKHLMSSLRSVFYNEPACVQTIPLV